ncbi:hypothetical protein NC652_038054 [Populus alba x Populus x berolinensis]|nr:hypothetical protein NC652_038054 [Populus alba x Populus x berolinensis]
MSHLGTLAQAARKDNMLPLSFRDSIFTTISYLSQWELKAWFQINFCFHVESILEYAPGFFFWEMLVVMKLTVHRAQPGEGCGSEFKCLVPFFGDY